MPSDRIKISENFYLDEFIYPDLYKSKGRKSRWYIDQRVIDIVQYIRTKTGKPVTVNTWWNSSGGFKLRGLRPFNTGTGASLSQHKFGKAADFDVKGYTAEQVRDKIKNEWKDDLMKMGLSAIEDGVNWVHIDVRNTGKDDLMIFNP